MARIDLGQYLEVLNEPEDRETAANREYQERLFLEYLVRDGSFPEERKRIQWEHRAGKRLTGPKGLRRQLAAFDLEYFGRRTFPTTSCASPRHFTASWTGSGATAF